MTHPPENPTTPEPVQAEPVACSQCGHVVGEESDLLTIAYMSGVYDERKSRENGLRTRPTSELAERIEGVVAALNRSLSAWDNAIEFGLLSPQYRDPAREMVAEGRCALAALKEVNSHDRT